MRMVKGFLNGVQEASCIYILSNFGTCMPRVDPTAAGMQRPDAGTARTAAKFAQMHEEYLTDWSLGKAEKWTVEEMDNSLAKVARPGSPLHTDSESDGSEELDDSEVLEKCGVLQCV